MKKLMILIGGLFLAGNGFAKDQTLKITTVSDDGGVYYRSIIISDTNQPRSFNLSKWYCGAYVMPGQSTIKVECLVGNEHNVAVFLNCKAVANSFLIDSFGLDNFTLSCETK